MNLKDVYKTNFSFKRKWKRRDLIFLLERLELYISAGLPMNEALGVAQRGAPRGHIQDLLAVKSSVESGMLLSKALAKHVSLASVLGSLVEHGESSGQLAHSLGIAKSILERQDELIKKSLSAMMYPIVIAVFALVLTIALVRGVMPQIIPILTSLHAQLPLLTRITIAFSGIIIGKGIYIIVALVLVAIFFRFAYARWFSLRYFCHWLLLKVPLIGSLAESYVLSVFFRSLGALVEAGVSVTYGYENTVQSIPLIPLRLRLQSKITDLVRGVSASVAFSDMQLPSYIISLISAGEVSGTLGLSLIRVAGILDRDLEDMLKKLTALIEPLLMAGMGCVVGCIALSIVMPIYDISKVLQH